MRMMDFYCNGHIVDSAKRGRAYIRPRLFAFGFVYSKFDTGHAFVSDSPNLMCLLFIVGGSLVVVGS